MIPAQTIIWDFGDGNSVTNVENPSHIYQQNGTFEITLIVIDPSQCNEVDTATAIVVVGENCCQVVVNDTFYTCENDPFTFPNGETESDEGTYTYFVEYQDPDCDSVFNFTLIHHPIFDLTISQTTCIAAEEGTVISNFTTIKMCDSIVTIITELITIDTVYLFEGSCFPEDTGMLTNVLINQCGNDSIVIIQTALYPTDSVILMETSCFASDTGIQTTFLTNRFNCDSFITIITTLLPTHDTSVQLLGCSPADTGVFINILTNQYGCDSTITSYVTLTDFMLDTIIIDSANCLGLEGHAFIQFSGGFAPYNIDLTGISNEITNSNTQEFDLTDGSFTISITDSFGCTISETFIIHREESIEVDVIPPFSTIFLGESVDFFASPQNGQLQWTPPDYLSCDTCYTPTSLPGQSIEYLITRTNDIGCLTYDTVYIEVTEPEVFLPSAFTPDGDGLNDVLNIIKDYTEDIDIFRIYNRWGEVVFETEDIDEGWDGIFKNEPQEMDVYVYFLKLTLIVSGKVIEDKGTITLLR